MSSLAMTRRSWTSSSPSVTTPLASSVPYWPGQPMTAHWGIPDPAAVKGSEAEQRHAFIDAYAVLRRRIELLASLPIDKLDRLALSKRVEEIGRQ